MQYSSLDKKMSIIVLENKWTKNKIAYPKLFSSVEEAELELQEIVNKYPDKNWRKIIF